MTDLDRTASDDVEKSDSGDKSAVDYKRKYQGQVKAYDRLRAEFDALQRRYDEAVVAHEGELATARQSVITRDNELKSLKSQVSALEIEKAKALEDLAAETAVSKQRSFIKDKFSALLDLFEAGDLRKESEFATPEAYVAYLERMNGRIAPVQTDEPPPVEFDTPNPELKVPSFEERRLHALGAVPATNTSNREGKKTRTVDDIVNERERLDGRDPNNRQKIADLEAEMDAIFAKQRQRF